MASTQSVACSFRSQSRSRGFTLIELLVVIGVIAVLVALLMPMFGVARESANSLKCQSHERAILLAMTQHANDHEGYMPMVGLPHNFSIYDSADQTKVVKEALKALEMSATNFPPGSVHSAISNAKNDLKTPEDFASGAKDFYHRQVARVYSKYQQMR